MTNKPLALDENMTVGDVRILAAGGQLVVMTPFDQHALRAVDLLEVPDDLPFLKAYGTVARALAGRPLSAYVLETVVRGLPDLRPSYNAAFEAMAEMIKAQRKPYANRACIEFLHQLYQRIRGGFAADPEVVTSDMTTVVFLLATRATQHLHAQGVPLDPETVATCADFVPVPPWKDTGMRQSMPSNGMPSCAEWL
jgi:hypothetical protein